MLSSEFFLRKRMHQQNQEVRKAGVMWMPCKQCGQDWPFPKGDSWINREFLCVTCCNNEVARIQRLMNEAKS